MSRRTEALLVAAVVLRMAFHAVYLPAFEGPDEPFHLARMWIFAHGPLREAFEGREVPEAVRSAVASYPCSDGLGTTFGCPPYGSRPAAFDLLRPAPAPPPSPRGFPNPEANQPPLYYALAGWAVAPLGFGPAATLLFARLLSVALVAAALLGPLRALATRFPPGLATAGLLALLLPGASEGLVRCSNDAAVFLWASCLLAALREPTRVSAVVWLCAVGPAIKLTAIPIVVLAVATLAASRRIRPAAAAVAVSLAVFPLQAARGWMWGGTLELNDPGRATGEAGVPFFLGFLRSVYAFVKTAFWIGGYSLLRPPRWLTAAYGAWLAGLLLAFRRSAVMDRAAAHAAAAVAAAAGFTVFAVANRLYYGDWGGVGGWYLWGWTPWLVEAVSDLGGFAEGAVKPLLAGGALLAVVANVGWFAFASAAYGG